MLSIPDTKIKPPAIDCSRSPYAIGQYVFNANQAHVPDKMAATCSNEFN